MIQARRAKKWALSALWTILGVSVTGTSVGCKQQLYLHQDDHLGVMTLGLPKDLDSNPGYSITPSTRDDVRLPPTVDNPDQPARYISLQEAIMIGLEQGNRGNANAAGLANLGAGIGRVLANDDLVQFTGRGVQGDDAIRAFALNPAIVAADIEGALAKFDARWVTSMNWQKQDNAVVNALANFNNGDQAQFSTGIIKPLPTGGMAGITFNTNYTKLTVPPQGFQVVNPAFTPNVTLNFEQPLLRDWGVDINQLTGQHPNPISFQNYRPTGGRQEGILITRIRYEQAKFQFEREVNLMLVNIEFAYWNLYSAYFGLYAADQGLRQSHEAWRLTKILQEAGTRAEQEVAQARARFEEFRGRRISALQGVLESERQLRSLLGMPVQDGTRLVPSDIPTQAPYLPDYKEAVNEMFANRPELNMARQDLKARQLDLLVQKNNVRPDLRFFSSYNVNGIGTRLDGSEAAGNALGNLTNNTFNGWNLGLRMDVPIGFRDANAQKRVSELNLANSFVVLKNQELRAERYLMSVYQQLFVQYETIQIQRERRKALASQLEKLFTRVNVGRDPLIILLDAQRDFADAIRAEHEAIANYNIAIAGFQYAKGTVMNYSNVVINEGPLPNCALTPTQDVAKRGRFRRGVEISETSYAPVNDIPQAAPVVTAPEPQLAPAPANPPAATPAVPQLPNPAPAPAPAGPIVGIPGNLSVPTPLNEDGRPIITVTSTPAGGAPTPLAPSLPNQQPQQAGDIPPMPPRPTFVPTGLNK